MPTQDSSQSQQESPFEIVTPGKSKKGGSKGIIIALAITLFLALGIFAGVVLVRQRQQISEKAAKPKTCPDVEACPNAKDPTLLQNCTPAEADNSPSDSICSAKGRIESCGGRQYCCPGPNQAWTANLTLCATSPTPTASVSPTLTSTSTIAPLVSQASMTPSPTPSPTKTSTAISQATTSPTKAPIPETGTSWPTYLGVGVGIFVIIGSLLLAL